MIGSYTQHIARQCAEVARQKLVEAEAAAKIKADEENEDRQLKLALITNGKHPDFQNGSHD